MIVLIAYDSAYRQNRATERDCAPLLNYRVFDGFDHAQHTKILTNLGKTIAGK
jgi:hypothetical protein